jgi:hypothetical protein
MSSKRAKRNFVAFKSKKRYQRFLDKMNFKRKQKLQELREKEMHI